MPPKRGRRLGAGLVILVFILLTSEIAARSFGLHTPVLYERTSYGYRVKPGQDIRRFGHRVFYNSYGLRSEPMSLSPTPGVIRILCLGDSITNGGTSTDQSETYPYLLERYLRERGINAEVLNASAGGWALENEGGWLAEHGTLDARILVLEVATHDLFQEMALSSIVDSHPSFPSRVSRLASEELIVRYFLPRLFPSLVVQDPGTNGTQPSAAAAQRSVERVVAMSEFAARAGAQSIVLQVEQPAPFEPNDEITRRAKALLEHVLRDRGVPLIETADLIAAHGGGVLFRDPIHPNPQGNRVLARAVAGAIEPIR